MGAFEANNGRWGVLTDLMYLDLSFTNPSPGPVFSGVQADLKSTVFQLSGLYRAYDSSDVRLDLLGAFAGTMWTRPYLCCPELGQAFQMPLRETGSIRLSAPGLSLIYLKGGVRRSCWTTGGLDPIARAFRRF